MSIKSDNYYVLESELIKKEIEELKFKISECNSELIKKEIEELKFKISECNSELDFLANQLDYKIRQLILLKDILGFNGPSKKAPDCLGIGGALKTDWRE